MGNRALWLTERQQERYFSLSRRPTALNTFRRLRIGFNGLEFCEMRSTHYVQKMEEVSVPGEAHKNPTATRIRYPINAVGTAVKCSAATLGTVIVIGVFTDIPYRITHDVIPHVGMVLRQASGPRTGGLLGYNGNRADPHSAAGR